MSRNIIKNVAYGLNNPLQNLAPQPIVSNRAPTTADLTEIGRLWIEPKDVSGTAINAAWVLTSIINNSANWLSLQASGSAGVFSSLVVTPGPVSLTGTTSINISGAGVTTIGTGGTGAVNIGNATGNTAVTGSLGATTTLTAGTGITATTGNIVATDGNITANGANRRITGTSIYASGDAGGVAGTTGITNLANSAVSTGVMVINSTTANPGANAGYLQFYLGSVAVYVPYFTDIAP